MGLTEFYAICAVIGIPFAILMIAEFELRKQDKTCSKRKSQEVKMEDELKSALAYWRTAKEKLENIQDVEDKVSFARDELNDLVSDDSDKDIFNTIDKYLKISTEYGEYSKDFAKKEVERSFARLIEVYAKSKSTFNNE